jgi:putative membrane protein
VALSVLVMFPQIGLGAVIAFATRDLYPFYNLCGRLYPSITALADQRFGGLIMWIPPAMMSAIGVVVVMNSLRLHENTLEETSDDAAALAERARAWTGL